MLKFSTALTNQHTVFTYASWINPIPVSVHFEIKQKVRLHLHPSHLPLLSYKIYPQFI